MGAKTSQSSSRSLDRSVSAPTLGSRKPSLAEAVRPPAAKSAESLPERPAAQGREELPPTLRNLSDRDTFTRVDASPAGTEPSCSPNRPSLNSCAKPGASGNPKPSCAKGSGPGLEPPLEEAEGSRLPCVAVRLPSSRLELSQTGPKLPEELGMEQSPDEPLQTTRTQEDFSASPSPANRGRALDYFLPEGSGAQDGKLKFSCEGAQRPESAPHKLPGSETLMEVEVTDQALTAAENRLKERNVPLSAMNSECSVMEAESSKSDSSLSTSDVKQPGRVAFESTDTPAAVGFPGSPPPEGGQLSRQADEACPSLASALKELHQLLVASYQKASRHESADQPGTLPDEGIAAEEVFEGKPRACRDRDVQEVGLSSPEGGPKCLPSEASAGGPFSGDGAEERQETLKRPDKGALVIEETLDLASCEPPGGECSETLPLCLSSDQTAGNKALVEQNPPPSSLTQGGESRRVVNFSPASSSADRPGALHFCSPEIDSAAPRPPGFPSVDIDQIVRAGFTPQEASEALERAGGDVDLALLILLAKKIAVPT